MNRQIIPESGTAQGPVESFEVSPTLDTSSNPHAVMCMRSDHLSQNGTLVSDNVSKTLDVASQPPVLCIETGQAEAAHHPTENVSATLNCNHEQPIVCIGSDSSRPTVDEDVVPTLHVGGGVPMIASGRSALAAGRESGSSTSERES